MGGWGFLSLYKTNIEKKDLSLSIDRRNPQTKRKSHRRDSNREIQRSKDAENQRSKNYYVSPVPLLQAELGSKLLDRQ